jgi:uncharacterized protein
MIATTLAGEDVVLDGDRALYWPRTRTLVVADLHFGKAHVFRRAGIGIPRGTTTRDLARIDALVARHAAERLLVLGDFVHGPSRPDAPWAERVREWRRERARLVVQVVKGNHDRHFDARALGIDVVAEPSLERPFAFAHHPGATPGAYTLAGHLHPGVMLAGMHERAARLPAFRFGSEVGLLPAFGSLTGLWTEAPRLGERVFVVADGSVIPL